MSVSPSPHLSVSLQHPVSFLCIKSTYKCFLRDRCQYTGNMSLFIYLSRSIAAKLGTAGSPARPLGYKGADVNQSQPWPLQSVLVGKVRNKPRSQGASAVPEASGLLHSERGGGLTQLRLALLELVKGEWDVTGQMGMSVSSRPHNEYTIDQVASTTNVIEYLLYIRYLEGRHLHKTILTIVVCKIGKE